MYKINSFIVYGKKVCKIVDIKKNDFNNEDYYLLVLDPLRANQRRYARATISTQ